MRKTIIIFIIVFYNGLLSSQVWKPLYPLLYKYGEHADIYTLTVYNNKLLICGSIVRIGNWVLPQPQYGSWGRPIIWDGNVYDTITNLSRFYGMVYSFTEYEGKLYCGGVFNNVTTNCGVGDIPYTKYIARYNGTDMEALSNVTPSSQVRVLATRECLYVGGAFYYIGSNSFRAIAKYDGTNYTTLNGGMYGMNPYVNKMVLYNDDLVVSGGFDGTQGMFSPSIAVWNGSFWYKLKDEYLGTPCDIVVDTNNNFLYIAGGEVSTDSSSGMKRWDGYNWEDLHLLGPVAISGMNAGSRSLAYTLCMYKKELYAALFPADTVAFRDSLLWRYDGLQWYNIHGIGNNTVMDMCVYNDDLYLGGGFTIAGNDSVNGIVALHMDDPVGCNWLIPRVFSNSDTVYLSGGTASVQFYNNNAYAQSWQWVFGDSENSSNNVKDPLHNYTQTGTFTATVTVTMDGCVRSAQKNITVLLGTGAEEYSKERTNFKLYPNPTTGELTIEATINDNNNAELRLYSNYGNLQIAYPLEKGHNIIKVNAKEYTAGIGLCCLYKDRKLIFTEKVMIEK